MGGQCYDGVVTELFRCRFWDSVMMVLEQSYSYFGIVTVLLQPGYSVILSSAASDGYKGHGTVLFIFRCWDSVIMVLEQCS